MKRTIVTLTVALLALVQTRTAGADEVFNKMQPDRKNRPPNPMHRQNG